MIDGQVPVTMRKAGLTPIMVMGVPRTYLGPVFLIGFVFSVTLKSPEVGIPVAVLFHLVLRALYARDPWFLQIFSRNSRYSRFMDT